jgi:hypothetical protein
VEKFTVHQGVAAPLLRANIDTDAIIPSREMKFVSKTGLADGLFAGWRYLDAATRRPDPAFVLNHDDFAQASILLAGANFGCGSCRRHGAALHRPPPGARGHQPAGLRRLKLAGRKPWRISSIVATADHNTPTDHWDKGIAIDPVSRLQVETLDANIRETGALAYFPFKDKRQGIVHVIGPENGATLPGMTVVCGDSHTSTHGAFGCLAHGIGTSEVEHVLATQCLVQKKSKNMLVASTAARPGVTPRTWRWRSSASIGTAGGTGYAIEFGGSAIRGAVDGRAHDGVQHGDRSRRARRHGRGGRHHDRAYCKGRPFAPAGAPGTRPSPTGAR